MGQEYLRQVTTQADINYLSNTILFDDFEDTLFKWGTSYDGTGATERNDSGAFRGGACARLKTNTTTPAAGNQASIYKAPAIRGVGIHELSFLLHLEDAGVVDYVNFIWTIYEGTKEHYLDVRFDSQNGVWTYKNTGGTYTAFSAIQHTYSGPNIWLLSRFVFDIGKDKILNYQCSTEVIDGLSIDSYKTVHGISKGSTLTVRVVEFGSVSPAEAWIDDIMIRQIA